MARCEDFPCCGHELGCCPDFDESGRQLNMVCTCGAKLPITSRFSICEGCLERSRREDDPYYDDRADEQEPDDEPGDGMTDAEADADTLKSAGWGTDEDYGYFGEDE
jgi:hypothetical protein